MSRNKILIVLLFMLSIGIISLYTTYAYEGDNTLIKNQQDSNFNLLYTLKDSTNKEIILQPKEEKFIDISLKNQYEATVRYGMYYYMINPTKLPDNVEISLAEDSVDALENIIKPDQTRSISIKLVNNSEYTINLIIGALIGFENGDINELVTSGEVLIK